MFAFLGVELIGVTAGEAQNPEKTIPSAINKVIWRILIFYVGALIDHHVAGRLEPPRPQARARSWWCSTKVGIPAAAGIVNFVVLTAALSSCNSGIFSTGRMLYTLAGFRQAPAALRKVSRQKVPAAGMVVSFVAMLGGVVLNYFIPASAFAYITSIATVCGLFVWGMVMVSHLRYRRVVNAGRLSGGQVPDAADARRELVRARLPRVGAGAAGVQPRHQDRVVRSPCLGAGDGDRIFRLARTPHPTDPRARRGGHPGSQAKAAQGFRTNGRAHREASVTSFSKSTDVR